MPRLTDALANDLHRRYMAGERMPVLAAVACCHSHSLTQRWRRMGLPVRPPGRPVGIRPGPSRATIARVARIRRLRAEGKTWAQCGEAEGISKQAAHQLVMGHWR